METRKIINANTQFEHHTCTSAYHRWSFLFPYVLTDGAKALAEEYGAYWLMDIIASYQREPLLRANQGFQVWELNVSDQDEGNLICHDGDRGEGTIILARQRIPYTDFKARKATLWYESGVILLPSEH